MESELKPTMEVEDVNRPLTARERVLIDKMEQHLEKSESIQMEVTQLEYYFVPPEDADICIKSCAERARDECGGQILVLLDTEEGSRGAEVADAVRNTSGADHLWTAEDRAELRQQEKNDAKYPELIP